MIQCRKCSNEVIPDFTHLGPRRKTKNGWYKIYDQECKKCNTPVLGIYFTNDNQSQII